MSSRHSVVENWRRWWEVWRRGPAVLHVTHWKAGSQWILKILNHCCHSRLVKPREDYKHLLDVPPRPGLVYPTVYAARDDLERLSFACPVRRFVVIRDPRDTMVSLYYSVKISHKPMPSVISQRAHLLRMTEEEGLCFLIERSPYLGRIIRSWLGGEDPLIRYEDLLRRDEEILAPVLLDHCRLRVSRRRVLEAIRANRFERLTKGRPRGQEDINAHTRKGIAGDWRNHFTARVKDTFKKHYGDLVVAAGYERDNSW